MAGETPGASRAGKNRKRLNFGDDKGTGKYYASNTPSVINNTQADTRGRIGSKPQPIPTNNPKLDERSADKKYYASPQAPKGIKPVRRTLGEPIEVQSALTGVADLTISRDTEVNPVMDEVVRRLSDGATKVIVTVADGSPMRRARAKLDSLVTRQLLTEDQARDVTFSKLPVRERLPKEERESNLAMDKSIEELLSAPPVPMGTRSLDEEEPVDIDSILSGATQEEVVDTSPQNVEEVDVGDDEGDDTEPAAEPATTEPAAQPVSTSQDIAEEASPEGSSPETVAPPAEQPADAEDGDGDEDGDE